MDWKQSAIEDLRKYESMKNSLSSIPNRARALQEQAEGIKGGMSEATPVIGGTSRGEDRLIGNISERQRLRHNYSAAKLLCAAIERGLAALDEQERLVLHRFYISRQRGYMSRICEELGYEERNVYNIRDKALKKFTISMYGIVDL